MLPRAFLLMFMAFSLVTGATYESHAATRAASQPAKKALLVIRFNQPRVYFESPLDQAINAAEQARPGIVYNIVSTIPVTQSAEQNQRILEEATRNLSLVISRMRTLGVEAARINATTTPMEIQSQEISIYVK